MTRILNQKNIAKAIAVMTRVSLLEGPRLDMDDWQCEWESDDIDAEPSFGTVQTDEKSLVGCGAPACFAGWLAVSQEFKAFGGHACPRSGQPVVGYDHDYNAVSGTDAIALFLGIDEGSTEADMICGLGNYRNDCYPTLDMGHNRDEDKPNSAIDATEVIAALERLSLTGTCALPVGETA